MSGGQAEVVHCHLLFHLPVKYRSGATLLQVEAAIYRLIKRHWADQIIKLVIHDSCLIRTANTSSRAAVQTSGNASASGKSIADCKASSTASAAALRRTLDELHAGLNPKAGACTHKISLHLGAEMSALEGKADILDSPCIVR
jgi:hypothetical protein